MKKIARIFIIAISSAVLLYGLFVGVDCVRLYNADISEPPIIITQPTKFQDDEIKYTGLGYTVTYKVNEEIETEENAWPQIFVHRGAKHSRPAQHLPHIQPHGICTPQRQPNIHFAPQPRARGAIVARLSHTHTPSRGTRRHLPHGH